MKYVVRLYSGLFCFFSVMSNQYSLFSQKIESQHNQMRSFFKEVKIPDFSVPYQTDFSDYNREKMIETVFSALSLSYGFHYFHPLFFKVLTSLSPLTQEEKEKIEKACWQGYRNSCNFINDLNETFTTLAPVEFCSWYALANTEQRRKIAEHFRILQYSRSLAEHHIEAHVVGLENMYSFLKNEHELSEVFPVVTQEDKDSCSKYSEEIPTLASMHTRFPASEPRNMRIAKLAYYLECSRRSSLQDGAWDKNFITMFDAYAPMSCEELKGFHGALSKIVEINNEKIEDLKKKVSFTYLALALYNQSDVGERKNLESIFKKGIQQHIQEISHLETDLVKSQKVALYIEEQKSVNKTTTQECIIL